MKIYELSVEDLSIITNLNSDYELPIIELESKSNKRFLISNNQINK